MSDNKEGMKLQFLVNKLDTESGGAFIPVWPGEREETDADPDPEVVSVLSIELKDLNERALSVVPCTDNPLKSSILLLSASSFRP